MIPRQYLPPNTAAIQKNPFKMVWRFTSANVGYKLCQTYPEWVVIPSAVDDKALAGAAAFRSKQRFAALSWKRPDRDAVIMRCSQPLTGVKTKRNFDDEAFIAAIQSCTPQKHKLHVYDARPFLNAAANKAGGKGYETEENYTDCEIHFLGIENIHVMRGAMQKLRLQFQQHMYVDDNAALAILGNEDWDNKEVLQKRDANNDTGNSDICGIVLEGTASSAPSSKDSWLKDLDDSGWLNHLSALLSGADEIASVVNRGESALIHCSDGWDRTSQLCALSEMLLDPYYRYVIDWSSSCIGLLEASWCL